MTGEAKERSPGVASESWASSTTPRRSYLLADCGSTNTKVALVEKQAGHYHLVANAEAGTTVEEPVNDVTAGLRDALHDLEVITGRSLLVPAQAELQVSSDWVQGCDALLACSSAGGGLQMLVMGAVRKLTAESATRAALGAGAIVSEVIACNDTRPVTEQAAVLGRLQPDIVLLSGGVDGGSCEHVLQLAELLAASEPCPRFGPVGELPVIFAGNRDARAAVAETLQDLVALQCVPNLRPTLTQENLEPARECIHSLFMTHVMSRAPGYAQLTGMCTAAIRPTPAACGEAIMLLANRSAGTILAVDVGGATTDVFSVQEGRLHRTVSANLGVSYSLAQVLHEVGLASILRWLTNPPPRSELHNRILNKMVRPTTIPHLAEDLQWEQAVATEAMALAFRQHRQMAARLDGSRQGQDVGDAFRQEGDRKSGYDITGVDLIVGRGGVLTHAPVAEQAALMLVNALAPEGVTRLALDQAGILPQIGMLATLDPAAADEVLHTDVLVSLGTCVSPLTHSSRRQGRLARYRLQAAGEVYAGDLSLGEIKWHPLPVDTQAELTLEPARGVDWGAGPGQALHCQVQGGLCGVILDGRDRPHQVTDLTGPEDWS